MSELFKVSSNPHIRSKVTTNGIMAAVIIALLPATGFGIYNFGIRALFVILTTIASTVLTEFLFGLYKKKQTFVFMFPVIFVHLKSRRNFWTITVPIVQHL